MPESTPSGGDLRAGLWERALRNTLTLRKYKKLSEAGAGRGKC